MNTHLFDVRPFHLFRTLGLALAALISFPLARAVDGTWTATASGNWSDSANWQGGAVAGGVGATAGITSNIGAARTVTLDTTPRTLGVLDIGDSNNTHAFTLAASGGAALTLNNNGLGARINQVATGKGVTISADIALADAATLANASGSALTLSGTITGGHGLAIDSAGAGAVQLGGAGNAFSSVVVKKGLLEATQAGALGSGAVTLGDVSGTGAAVTLGAAGAFSNALVVAGTGTATLVATGAMTWSGGVTLNRDLVLSRGGGNLTMTGLVSGSGALVVNSNTTTETTTVTLQNRDNAYTGGTLVRKGTVVANTGSGGVNHAFGSGEITLGDAAGTGEKVTVKFDVTATFENNIRVVGTGESKIRATDASPTFTGAITLEHDVSITPVGNSAGTLTVTGDIGGAGDIGVSGNRGGRVVLNGSVNHAGRIVVNPWTDPASSGNYGLVIGGAIGANVTDIVQTGAGAKLFLTGAGNAFTGKVDLQGGLLKLGLGAATTEASFLTDTTRLWLYTTNGSGLVLDFKDQTVVESVAGLYIDNLQQAVGRWGALGSVGLGLADYESALITGTGLLYVGAIPEPSACALLAGALALGIAWRRPRRRAPVGRPHAPREAGEL